MLVQEEGDRGGLVVRGSTVMMVTSLGDGIRGNSRPVPSIGEKWAADNVQREKGRDAA